MLMRFGKLYIQEARNVKRQIVLNVVKKDIQR